MKTKISISICRRDKKFKIIWVYMNFQYYILTRSSTNLKIKKNGRKVLPHQESHEFEIY